MGSLYLTLEPVHIPEPSKDLLELLSEFTVTPRRTSREAKRFTTFQKAGIKEKPKKKRVNGFIAYRSFYSKNIRQASLQRTISSRLAHLWRRENSQSQETWRRIALQYNSSESALSFAEWITELSGTESALCAETQQEFIQQDIEPHTSLTRSSYIEDVFEDRSSMSFSCQEDIFQTTDPRLIFSSWNWN